jgi:hypothetical protein
MARCMLDLGLRACEVAGLHLDDLKLNYQFNRQLSLRAILDHASLVADPALAKLDHERTWTPDVLLTYLVHPGTALYTDRHENLAVVPGPVPTLDRTAQADTSVAGSCSSRRATCGGFRGVLEVAKERTSWTNTASRPRVQRTVSRQPSASWAC